jgi:hypothetical protein
MQKRLYIYYVLAGLDEPREEGWGQGRKMAIARILPVSRRLDKQVDKDNGRRRTRIKGRDDGRLFPRVLVRVHLPVMPLAK